MAGDSLGAPSPRLEPSVLSVEFMASPAQYSHHICKRLHSAWGLVQDIHLKVITSFRLNTYMELLKLHFQKWR